jgi:hypothetical protein
VIFSSLQVYRVKSLGFRVHALGFRVHDLGPGGDGVGFRV